jgi:hypothetical protein
VFANRLHDTEHDKRCKAENAENALFRNVLAFFFIPGELAALFWTDEQREATQARPEKRGQIDWDLHAI